MKKLLILSILAAILFTSCSILSAAKPTATVIPLPSATPEPDPCSKDNILAEAEKIQMAINEFREVADIANSTDVNFLFIPILRLEELRYEAIKTEVPECLDSFKSAAVNYTSSVVNYLVVFMNVQDPQSEDLNAAIQNSQTQWQVLLNEFNKILAIAEIEPQVAPDISNLEPTPTFVVATATNQASQTVNVRTNPDLNASVITSMEKDVVADVIGRNADGDWLQVTVNGISGWVFTEMVVVSVPVDQLQVIEPVP